MKERGKYQIQCMKSRSSTGVGQKIDLEYNMETMRITDEGGEEEGVSKKPTSSFMEQIKAKSTVKSADSTESKPATWEKPEGGTHAWDKPMAQLSDAPKVSADIQSAKLKQLLGQIKSQ
jgi:hypothetical protein